MLDISSAQRRELRALAHSLAPVVLIGGSGLTPSVIAEIERNLVAHELIKIRASGAEREDRDSMMLEICAQTGSAPVQHIGKTLVIYRPAPKKDKPAGRPARTSGYGASENARRSARKGAVAKALARSATTQSGDPDTDRKPRSAFKKRPAKSRPTTRR